MANLKEIRINYFRFIYDANYISDENGFCSKAKAQDAITAMRPYAEKLTELLQNLSATLEEMWEESIQHNVRVKKVLVVAITSNRGLCGAFNSNVIKASKTVLVLCRKTSRCFAIGKKGRCFS
jgi:F-type H+-transporting ATPase subunit gamma